MESGGRRRDRTDKKITDKKQTGCMAAALQSRRITDVHRIIGIHDVRGLRES